MTESHRMKLTVVIHDETATAILVSAYERRAGAVWLPKSLVAVEGETEDGRATLLITRALATTKGLI